MFLYVGLAASVAAGAICALVGTGLWSNTDCASTFAGLWDRELCPWPSVAHYGLKGLLLVALIAAWMFARTGSAKQTANETQSDIR